MRVRLYGAAPLVLAAFIASGCAGGGQPAVPFNVPPATFRQGTHFVVVGDLQRTAPFLEFFREQNDAERALVVRAIAADRPDLLVITGDCVFDGASDAQWAAFDELVNPLHVARVPAVSAFGNHEYWGGRHGAEEHLLPRFPGNGGHHWFALPVESLRLVILDSNRGELGADWATEVNWYERTLAAFDADPAVRGVLVAFHHPPFTNSTVTSDDADVREFLLPPFARAKKTMAMLNGHVHSYERFVRDDKAYIVSGGGGGPRARLAAGGERRHPDDRYDGPVLRDFHFTRYTIGANGVSAEVRGLDAASTTWRVMDRFELPWPRAD